MLRLLFVSGLVLLVAGAASAVQLQSWVATARIQSGNTTLTDSPNPVNPPPGPDVSTGFLEANGVNVFVQPPAGPPLIDAGAEAVYGLSNGVLAGTTGYQAMSNEPDDLRIYTTFAGASAIYADDLVVTSSSLAAGTAVDVRFVFDLAFANGVTASQNTGFVAADLSSVAAGQTGIDQAANRFFQRLDDGLLIQNGVFTGSQNTDYTISTAVGQTFGFSLVVDVSSFGRVSPSGGANATANGFSAMAVSFGAEVLGGQVGSASVAGLVAPAALDAQLMSGLLGGLFPDAANVSRAAAEAALPENRFQSVPEPAALALGLLALGLGRFRLS